MGKFHLSVSIVSRLLHHALTMQIFCEPTTGILVHMQTSRIILDSATNDCQSPHRRDTACCDQSEEIKRL
ncbi:hypothetical protein F4679DRAFT_92375 [Xylaria curta]|nr:hypothetical protein F4679DRAFT_92375 [Xylaria curta]